MSVPRDLGYDGTWHYVWEHGIELAAMTSGNREWNFSYDAGGMRTKRTNGEKTYTYVYDGGLLSQMTVDGNTLRFTYDANGAPLTLIYNGTTYFYVTNLQGDVISIRDSSGTALVSYTYDAWGNASTACNTDVAWIPYLLAEWNPLRYRGYVYDIETNLYYLQSRYYNPAWGRFLNADALVSTGQGPLGNNMFAYCNNNPVMYVDPHGTVAEAVIVATIMAAVYILSIIETYSKSVTMSDEGVSFIAQYETFSATPYDDGVGNMTIGYGHVIKQGETFVTITEEEALVLLKNDIAYFERQVVSYSKKHMVIWDQNEFDAFVSLAYNSGSYFECVMDKIIQGIDPYEAFSTVIYANGKKLLGLYRRRMDEADMFVKGTYERTYRNW